MEHLFPLIISALLGSLIGLERELHRKFAGIKTHLLVSLGACLFTLLALYIPDNTGRMASQIISGIGFIGAGVIMKNGDGVKGITTASCLWISAYIGVSCGLGKTDLALIVTTISLVSMLVFGIIEKRIHKND